MTHGEVASYIPELLKADPEWFGIAIVTVDGHVYQVGDTQQAFTIQSISKVITYGIALEDNGVEAVLKKINVEPSGEAFNSISLEPRSYEKGASIFRTGDPATGLFFILSGQVSEVVRLDHRRTGRITTLSAGSAFGEMAMLDHGVRSADVIADTDISCLFPGFERLEKDRSEVLTGTRLKLITNIGRVLSQKLRQATVEIKSLKR